MGIVDSLREGRTVVIGCSWLERETLRPERRPWRERLLSRPWRPWEATRLVLVSVPDEDAVYVVSPGVLVCHDSKVAKLRRWLDDNEGGGGNGKRQFQLHLGDEPAG